jgi:hypothetical protein
MKSLLNVIHTYSNINIAVCKLPKLNYLNANPYVEFGVDKKIIWG